MAEDTKALTMDDVLTFIDNMKIIEMGEFVKKIEERYGVSAAMPVAAAGAAVSAAGTAAPVEEKTSFDVILTNVGEKKIQVIKVVREITSLGLKEAKELVDGAPKSVKEGVSKEEADAIKAKLTEVGAQVDIK